MTAGRLRAAAICCSLALAARPLPAQERPDLPPERDPNDWQSYYQEGIRLLRLSRGERAESYFAYAARLEPTAAEPLLARVAAWWNAHPERWNLWVNDDPLVRNDSGVRLAERGFERAYLVNPFVQPTVMWWASPGWANDPPDDPYARGLAWYFRGRWEASAKEFGKYLRRHPDAWSGYYWRSLVYVQLQRWDSAGHDLQTLLDSLASFETAHTLTGDLGAAELYYTLGLVRRLGGDRAGAKAALEQTFQRDLAFFMGHQHYGAILLEEGDTTGALREFALSVEVQPENEALRFNYGTVLLQAGRFDSAAAQLNAAIRLNPEYASPYFNGALALERAGRPADARPLYEAFVHRAPRRLDRLIALAQQRLAGP